MGRTPDLPVLTLDSEKPSRRWGRTQSSIARFGSPLCFAALSWQIEGDAAAG